MAIRPGAGCCQLSFVALWVMHGRNVVLPYKVDSISSLDGNISLAGLGALVAVDVGGVESIGRDEAVVLVKSVPTSGYRPRLAILNVIPPNRVRTLSRDPVVPYAGDEAL